MKSKYNFKLGKDIVPFHAEEKERVPLSITNEKICGGVVNFLIIFEELIESVTGWDYTSPHKKAMLGNFFQNVNEANIVIKRSFFSRSDSSFTIDEDGKVNIVVCNDNESLYRELFRLASYNKEGETTFLGLSQSHNEGETEVIVGEGLSSGYLNLLTGVATRKHGTPDEEIDFNTEVMKKLEMILGTERVFTLFFSNDLNGLVEELASYSSLEDAKHFVYLNDIYYYRDNSKVTGKKKTEDVKKIVEDINSYLIDIFVAKIEQEDIDEETRNKRVEKFISTFELTNEDGRKEYPILPKLLDLRKQQ